MSVVEALLLHALNFDRKDDAARAAKAFQAAGSIVARWGDELAALKEHLGDRSARNS